MIIPGDQVQLQLSNSPEAYNLDTGQPLETLQLWHLRPSGQP